MSAPRRRNAVLATVELLRRHEPSINMSQVRAFLYVCENEGLSVSELSELLSTTRATGSRVARSLACEGAPDSLSPHVGLVWLAESERGEPLKSIRLTETGRRFRTRIDSIIADACPIQGSNVDLVQ
jgi:DNA-binding MarR family transcriptional regulator